MERTLCVSGSLPPWPRPPQPPCVSLALWIHPAGFCLAVCPPPYICTLSVISHPYMYVTSSLSTCLSSHPPTHPSSLYALVPSCPLTPVPLKLLPPLSPVDPPEWPR